jgi:hypothetical protein
MGTLRQGIGSPPWLPIAICKAQNPSKKKPRFSLMLLKCKVLVSNLLDVILDY